MRRSKLTDLAASMQCQESELLVRLLNEHGSQQAAANALGVTPRYFNTLYQKYRVAKGVRYYIPESVQQNGARR